MKINEVVINIPIKIDLDGANPRINVAGQPGDDDTELDQNPVMMGPQQQELELKKAEHGKMSPSIEKILSDNNLGNETDTSHDDSIMSLRTLAGLI